MTRSIESFAIPPPSQCDFEFFDFGALACRLVDGVGYKAYACRGIGGIALCWRSVRIGSSVWFGAGLIIVMGVPVGIGPVIGSGGGGKKTVNPGARVAGAPAGNLPEEAGIK